MVSPERYEILAYMIREREQTIRMAPSKELSALILPDYPVKVGMSLSWFQVTEYYKYRDLVLYYCLLYKFLY